MKYILNLIFILLIAVSLYVLPINTSLFDINISNVLEDKPDKTDDSNGVTSYAFTKLPSKNKYIYSLRIDSTGLINDSVIENIKCDFEFIDLNGEIKKFDEKSVDFKTEKTDKSITFDFDLSNTSLNLLYTNYEVKLKISYKENIYEDTLKFLYVKEDIKLQDNKNIKETIQLIPIYYSDKKNKYNIPIYRTYIDKSNKFSNVLYTAAENSNDIKNGILNEFPMDLSYRPRMWFNNGELSVHFSESNINKIKDKNLAKMTIEGIVNSMAEAPLDYVVSELNFVINWAEKQEIAGFPIDKPFKVNKSPAVYLPLFYKQDSYYWVPIKFELSEKLSEDVKIIFTAYTGQGGYINDGRFISLMPNKEFVKNVTLMDKTLRLELNKEFEEFYKENLIYAQMILEGLSLSLTSIENIESFELWVDGAKLKSLGGYNFNSPITRPNYFNIIY